MDMEGELGVVCGDFAGVGIDRGRGGDVFVIFVGVLRLHARREAPWAANVEGPFEITL